MVYAKEGDVFKSGVIQEAKGTIAIKDFAKFRETEVDSLVETIILGQSDHMKKFCFWVAYNAALACGVVPSSIQGLYEAMGKGRLSGFTVPAMNIRTLTYDLVRAVFRSAKKIDAGSFIFEIAKSEIGYTDQRPMEYSSMIMLAAIKEGYKGPVFIQGDHFQLKAKNYLQDKEKEVNQLKEIIKEAIDASFYNIDIDSSTLVDLEKKSLDEQQKSNYEVCSLFTQYIRQAQPKGVTISVGGEIGEVGGKNSTPEELNAFIKGYLKILGKAKGISKISIQTGTSHGGVVLPDGSIAKVSIDFDTLKKLSEIARKEYGMAGAVQHGASTLPNEAFHHFPQVSCAEIHLATQFQNIVYDYLPLPLKEKIYAWLHANCAAEKKPGLTDDQFIYKTRKSALGPFKKEIFSLPKDWKDKISSVLEKEFSFLFEQLNIKNTKKHVDTFVTLMPVLKKKEDFLKEEKELGDLEGAD
ncbi:MAG: class II fructose-bisphosphate aldolase [Candidatus Omnitrophica bacterium]|nr:class II fructose-bisphosphate aldolase [Candidatus Omnitrophota bacterium]